MIDWCDEGQQHAAHAGHRRFGMAHLLVHVCVGAGADLDDVVSKAHLAGAVFEKNDLAGLGGAGRVFRPRPLALPTDGDCQMYNKSSGPPPSHVL